MLPGMVWQRLRRLGAGPRAGELLVVRHAPWRRVGWGVLVGLVVLAAGGLGYWLGSGVGELDRSYLASLEVRYQANEAQRAALARALADLRLSQTVDDQAAQSLRETISQLRGEVASLNEEVAFYKRLMVPSTIERGLRISEFQLAPGDKDNKVAYHILLTQVAERRDWLQGRLELRVLGQRQGPDGAVVEEVLPLTELAVVDAYPLRFRFRYFQDLTGTLTLPAAFTPQQVIVAATPAGAESVERRFDWSLHAD